MMNHKRLPTPIRLFIQILTVALIYYITARFGFLMALPPGNVTALWPPSGLALAAMLVWGWPMGVGVYLGSFVVNFETLSGSSAFPVATMIAAGSTLQAWGTAWLLRRFIKTLPPESLRDTLVAIGMISFSTLFAPLIGVTSMYVAGIAVRSQYVNLVSTWWLGDLIGVLVFTPSMVVLYQRWKKQKIKEPLLWSFASFMIGLTLFTFLVVKNAEEHQLTANLNGNTAEMSRVLKDSIDHDIQDLIAIGAFYSSLHTVESDQFVAFTTPLLENSSAISGLSLVPRVFDENRTPYEQAVRERGTPNFYIYEKDTDGNNIPAADRAEYFPITLIEPIAANKAAIGYDIGSSPARLETIIRARDGGKPAVTAPIHLVQETGNEPGILIMMPIYQSGASLATITQRRDNFIGLANGVYRTNALVENALSKIDRHDIELYIYDVENSEDPQFLAFYPSISGAQSLPVDGVPTISSLQGGLFSIVNLDIGGRAWLVIAHPGPKYIAEANGWFDWVVLLIGLLVVGTFLTYVSTRQKTEAVLAQSEAEFRTLSEHALTGVIRLRLSGEILYANQSFATMLGFELPQDVLNRDVGLYFNKPGQLDEIIQSLLSFGQILDREIEICTAKSEIRYLLCSASLSNDIVSANVLDITDRLQSEKEIRQLSRIASQMADTVVVTDKDGLIEYVNPAFEELTGYTRAEVVGQTPRVLKSGVHSLEFYEQLWQTILGGSVFKSELTNRKKNGDLYHENKTITPIRDAEGIITHFVATGHDITERKQIESALNESKLLFRLLMESLPQNIYAKDIEGRFIFVNQHYCAAEGRTSEEIVGKTDFELHPRELAEKYRQDDRQVIETGETIELVEEHETAAREKIFVQVIKAPFYDSNGQTAGTLGIFWDITERKLAEELLHKSQMGLEMAQSAAHLGSWEIDPETGVGSWSKEMFQLFGCDPMLGTPSLSEFMDLVHPEDKQIILDVAQQVKETNERIKYEYRVILPQGGLRYFEASSQSVRNKQGQIVVNGTVLDITETRQSEKALRMSDERFRQLAENILEVFWLYDMMERKIIYISPAYEIIWGRTCESLYQNTDDYIKSILPEDQPLMFEALEEQDHGERTELEYRVQRPDGTIRWVWDRSFPIFDESGKLVRTAGVATDITEEKITAQELQALNRELEKRVEERTAEVRQNEALYRALFEKSNDGIFLLSPEGEELRANQRALEMVGYTSEEYYELNKNEGNRIVPAEQQQDANDRFQAVLNGQSVPLYERTFFTKEGAKVEAEINLSAVRDADGKIILVQSVVRDITERKKAEKILLESRDQLSAANAALEKASRLKDEFLASMSHELRTPLTGILGLSEALQLQAYGELNEKQLKALGHIESSGRHLLELINDILDLSKIEAGKLDMQFEPCSVTDICNASLQLVKGMAHQKKQNIGFSINETSVSVRADARRLKQMLVNLLSNAVKFTPEGGQVGLEVLVSEKEHCIFFNVWDKGIGIKPEEMTKLFRPFTQLDSSLARQYAGTGLGLSLVQRMAELHGGSVKVESVHGEGSCFTIVLPWSAHVTRPLRGLTNRDTGTLGNTILIEDNVLDAEQTTRYLKELGIANVVHPVINGALEKVIALRPGLILLDINLPDGSGLDLLPQLKADERARNIPVVVVSVEERRKEALHLGAVGYLMKPFSQSDLRNELEKAASFAQPANPVMVISAPASAPLVLIADDNELILETITDFLGAKGFRVIATRNGFELLERAVELHPDIMLVDIQMPGMDGMETMRRVRAHSDPKVASTPMIALTALAMSGDREKCLQAGASEYMSKPVVLKQLIERIREFLK